MPAHLSDRFVVEYKRDTSLIWYVDVTIQKIVIVNGHGIERGVVVTLIMILVLIVWIFEFVWLSWLF